MIAANVRGGPGTSYRILGSVGQGTVLPVLRREGRWLYVSLAALRLGAQQGWISTAVTRPFSPEAVSPPSEPPAPEPAPMPEPEPESDAAPAEDYSPPPHQTQQPPLRTRRSFGVYVSRIPYGYDIDEDFDESRNYRIAAGLMIKPFYQGAGLSFGPVLGVEATRARSVNMLMLRLGGEAGSGGSAFAGAVGASLVAGTAFDSDEFLTFGGVEPNVAFEVGSAVRLRIGAGYRYTLLLSEDFTFSGTGSVLDGLNGFVLHAGIVF